MKKFYQLLSIIILFNVTVNTAEAGIFTTVKKEYQAVQAKTQELHDKFIAYQCPNLSGAELIKCMEVRNGYSFSYGGNDDVFLFNYKSTSENIFGQDRRQVEQISYTFRIEEFKVVIFTIERFSTGFGETFSISQPTLRVFIDNLSTDGNLTLLDERIEITVPGQGWVNYTLRGKPQAPHKKPRLHSAEANDGIWELHKAANRLFWD